MGPGGKGDCELTLSDLRLNVSADLIELAQNLERNVLAPLAAPAPDRWGGVQPAICMCMLALFPSLRIQVQPNALV